MEFCSVHLKRKQSFTNFFHDFRGVTKIRFVLNNKTQVELKLRTSKLSVNKKKLQNMPTYERESMVIGRTKETIVVGNA